jgi:hypothetical protein
MEGSKNSSENNIEVQANYEGNDSILLIERLRNPEIKRQLIDLFQQAYEDRALTGKPEVKLVLDPRTKMPIKGVDGKCLVDKNPFKALTREEIEEKIDARIDEAEKFTRISYTGNGMGENTVDLNWTFPNGDRPTTKQLSIIEAHEKGHRIRQYPHFGSVDPITRYFSKGFDPLAILYTEEDYGKEASILKGKTYEKARELLVSYLFSVEELAERMSQLKNYFGMTGSEKFTKEYLSYAREHYVEDTGVDNRMKFFFQAITPETEDFFIEIINTAGI